MPNRIAALWRIYSLWGVFVIFMFIGCSASPPSEQITFDLSTMSVELAKLLGGKVGAMTVNESATIRAYRVEPVDESYDQLSQYKMTSGPVVVSDRDAGTLRKTVLDHQTYLWDVAKACGPPVYGVRFEFATSDHRVDIMICYACDYLGVYVDGKLVDYEDCDNGRAALVAVAKAVFPQDGEIANLKQR